MTLKFSSKLLNRNIQDLSFRLDNDKIETSSIKLSSNPKIIEAVLKISKNEINNQTLEISLPELPGNQALYSIDEKSAFSNFPIRFQMDYYLPEFNEIIDKSSIPVQATMVTVGSLTMASEPNSSMNMWKLMQSLKFLSLINV